MFIFQDVSLETILNEDDVLNEVISNNQKLITFLSDNSQIRSMIKLIVDDPFVDTSKNDSANKTQRYKFANMVCEIFSVDGSVFADIITQNEEHMSFLWSFFQTSKHSEAMDDDSEDSSKLEKNSERILDPLLASLFVKIFVCFFQNKTEVTINFLLAQTEPNDLMSVILRHIDTSAIVDLVYKLWEYMSACDKLDQETAEKFNRMLFENGLIEKLVELFKDQGQDCKKQNAATLISDLVRLERDYLSNNTKVNVTGILHHFEK